MLESKVNSREKKSFITMLKTLFDCVLVDQSSLNSKKKNVQFRLCSQRSFPDTYST